MPATDFLLHGQPLKRNGLTQPEIQYLRIAEAMCRPRARLHGLYRFVTGESFTLNCTIALSCPCPCMPLTKHQGGDHMNGVSQNCVRGVRGVRKVRNHRACERSGGHATAQKPIVYVPRNFTAQGHGKVALRILQESCFGQIPRACRKLCNCVEECKSGRPIATKHYVAHRSNPACACAGAPYLSVLVLLVAFTLATTPASLPSMTGARAQDCGRPAGGAQRLRLTWPTSAMTDPILSGVGHCNIVPPPFFSTSRSTQNNYWYYIKLDYLHIMRTSIGPHCRDPGNELDAFTNAHKQIGLAQLDQITSRTEWSLVGYYWILTESSPKRGGHSEDLVRIA